MSRVPLGWKHGTLRDVCGIVSGGTPKTAVADFWGGHIAWVTPNDLSKDRSQTVVRGERQLTEAGYTSCSAKTFPAGSVIVSSRAPIGYVAIAGQEMCTNQGCKTAIPPDFIDPKYLYWCMLNSKADLESRASGTTFKEISGKGFGETELVWPDLHEQRRIVDILEDHLSRLDAAAGSMKAANRRLVALRRSVLNALFSGDAHARVPLRRLVTGIEAGRSFGGSSHVAADDEWGIIKVSAMTWGAFRASENKAIGSDRADVRYEIRSGDLLLSRANTSAYVGASVLVGEVRPRLLLSDKSLRLLPGPDVEREWLWRALSTPDARAQMSALATGTKDSMRNISQGALLNIELSAVPVADQRNAVARAMEVETAIEWLTAEVETAVARGQRLRRALLGAAFSGRLTGRSSDMEMVEEMAGV